MKFDFFPRNKQFHILINEIILLLLHKLYLNRNIQLNLIYFSILENDGPVTIILDSRSKKSNTTADEE